jgi:hypothetical protein
MNAAMDEINVTMDDINSTMDDINSNLENCFQSVSNGKALVASAITGKGVTTASDATFETMADNIGNIIGARQGEPNIQAPETTSPSFTAVINKLYVVTLAVQGVVNSCSLVSGATQIYKKTQYRSCGKGLYMHTFLVRATSTTVTFSINVNPAITWYQIDE